VKPFLDAIRQHGILRVSPAEYIKAQELLEKRPDLDRQARRAALASLLATSKEQWQEIARLFDLYFPAEAAETVLPPADETQPPPRRTLHAIVVAAGNRLRHAPRWLLPLLAAILLGGCLAVLIPNLLSPPVLVDEEPDPPPAEKPPKTLDDSKRWILSDEPFRPAQTKSIEVEPPARSFDARDGLTILLGSLLVLVGLRWLLLPGAVQQFRQTQMTKRRRLGNLERKRLAEQTERNNVPLRLTYQVERYPPLPEAAAADSATVLGRLFQATPSADLDTSATVRASIDAGGRLTPVYAARQDVQTLTVLVDIERGDHPWLAGIDWLLARWAALGVRLARYDFAFSPLFLTARPGGQVVLLSWLARHANGDPLLIISRTLSTQDRQGRARWLDDIDAWPVKAWLDPDPRPLNERHRLDRNEIRQLERLGLRRFPISTAGLLALARYFAEEGQGIQPPAWEPLAPLNDITVATALPRWALLAALVPDANWDQLEALRRHFPDLAAALPDARYVQRLIEWVAREDNNPNPESGDGRTLDFSKALVEKLICRQRERDAGLPPEQQLERQGRELLMKQLDATCSDDELLRQFWELKRVTHWLRLNPEQALEFMDRLSGGAVEAELQETIETELERQKTTPTLNRDIQEQLALEAGQAVNRVHLAELFGPPWRAWRVPGLTVLVALVLGAGLTTLPWLDWQAWLMRSANTTITAQAEIPAIRQAEWVASEFTDTLKDGTPGPVMVMIPGGTFMMGSPETEEGREDDERLHEVRVEPFAMGKYEVTVGEFRQFVVSKNYRTDAERESGCNTWVGNEWKQDAENNWRDPGFDQDDDHPVVCVSWNDAVAYANWLSEQTGQNYRLLTEAEWEYAARAGTETPRYWGDDLTKACRYANVYDRTAEQKLNNPWEFHDCEDGYVGTAPVGQFQANDFGLHDVLRNVWEWTCSEYDEKYGGAEQRCVSKNNASAPRVLRGGAWLTYPRRVRAACRAGSTPAVRYDYAGFRLARIF